MTSSFPKTAIILAGGPGTRMRPITYEIPKALMPVQGRTITEYLLDMFKKNRMDTAMISIGHLKDKIKNYFGDGSRFGIHISYIEEDKPLGTAGPIKKAKNHLTKTFIVSNGDELKDIDIRKMYDHHKKNGALVTIALTHVPDPTNYGVVELNGDRVTNFVEKPKGDETSSNLINAGFYIMEPGVLDYIPEGASSLEKDVFPTIVKEGKMFGYEFSGQWFDTGNFERYEKAIKEWKGTDNINTPDIRMNDGTIISERPWSSYKVLKRTSNHWVKEITLKPGRRTSLQTHLGRREIWLLLSGTVLIECGKKPQFKMRTNVPVNIPIMAMHRMTNIGQNDDAVILELAFGDCREDDIIRLEDDYSRANKQ